MTDVNWNIFNVKNPRYEDAFEDLCLHLFCRSHKIDAHNFTANFNQSGLEIEPYEVNGTYYGFQSKYISGNGDSFYDQVYKSLKKAAEIYIGRLDIIYVYTNLNKKPNVTQEELGEYQKQRNIAPNRKKNNRFELKILENEYNFKIKYITEPNFKVLLAMPENVDLYRTYFSRENINDLLQNNITISDRTFLKSDNFLDLPINESSFLQLKNEILASNTLIIGHAGTGKTEIMKSLFLTVEMDYLSKSNNTPIPIYIKLRECVNGNLEELIRQRLRDYYLEVTSSRKYIYFLDGLDEVYASFTSVFIAQIRLIEKKPDTFRIILSSRPNSMNLLSLRNTLSLKQYQIKPLDKEFIKLYFKLHNKEDDNIEGFSITESIDDILSIRLLYENFDILNNDTTKIDLIRYTINAMLTKNNELEKLELPMPYTKAINEVLKEIAIFMHHSSSILISVHNIQDIINRKYVKLNYKQTDAVISFISGLFFDSSTDKLGQIGYSFRHKRYFEYFLYLYISNEFYNDFYILREENLLEDKDFMINIFLTQELKNNILNRDIIKVLVLRFVEDYLGTDYFRGYENKWVGNARYSSGQAVDFLTSKEFLSYLCQKDHNELKGYLEISRNLPSDILNKENLWKFIRMYHERKNIDIKDSLCDFYQLDANTFKFNNNNIEDYLYYLIRVKGADIDKIYNIKIKNRSLSDLEKKLDCNNRYLKNELNLSICFFNLNLKYHYDWILKNISDFSLDNLEILCHCILLKQNIAFIIVDNELVDSIINRIDNNSEDGYYIHTKTLYTIKSQNGKYIKDINQRLEQVNISHYETWRTGLDLNNYCAAIFKNSHRAASREYILGVSLTRLILEKINNGNNVLDDIIAEIRKDNFLSENYFTYENSLLIGHIICSNLFSIESIKMFLMKLIRYESVISYFNVLYSIFEANIELFKVITNKSTLKKAYEYNISQLSYYDYLTDTMFRYAAMISYFDKLESQVVASRGINNSLLRPAFRKENIIRYTLPKCIETAYINNWLTDRELEYMAYRIWDMNEVVKDTLDSGADESMLQEIVVKYLPESELNEKFHEILHEPISEIIQQIKPNPILDMINQDNLRDYYRCNIKDVNYDNFSYWKQLIEYEYSSNHNLNILYEILEENYFPSQSWGKLSDCYRYIVSILIDKIETKDKVYEYLMEISHGDMIPLIIAVFSLTGREKEGKILLEYLFVLTESLVYLQKPKKDDKQLSTQYQALEEVYESKSTDWLVSERENKMVNLKNRSLSIIWSDDDREFSEPWATLHPDPKAYRRNFSILLDDIIIKEKMLVYVDGYRGLIPMPKISTNIISRRDYEFALIVNKESKSLHEYIGRSGLSID